MEQLRRIERNKLLDETKRAKANISINEESIERLRKQTENVKFNNTQIGKLQEKNEQKHCEIIDMKDRLENLDMGKLDKELQDKLVRVSKEVKNKDKATKKRKEDERKAKIIKPLPKYQPKPYRPYNPTQKPRPSSHNAEPSTTYSTTYNPSYIPPGANKSSDTHDRLRSSRQPTQDDNKQMTPREKSLQNSGNYYLKVCNSIPDYMLKNLDEMPNNKGYIWRDVVCYGKKASEPGKPVVLFEKKKDGLMIIHEWSKTECKIWHKQGKERKVLESSRKRKQKTVIKSDAIR